MKYMYWGALDASNQTDIPEGSNIDGDGYITNDWRMGGSHYFQTNIRGHFYPGDDSYYDENEYISTQNPTNKVLQKDKSPFKSKK